MSQVDELEYEEASCEETKIVKRFMYLNRKAPHGTIYALEVLEMILVTAAFEQDVYVAFIDDGIYQIRRWQNTSYINMKNFSPIYRVLVDYEVDKLYVEKESLEERGLSEDDLVVPVNIIDRDTMCTLIHSMDVVLGG